MRPEGTREDLRRGATLPGRSMLHREREGVVLDQEIAIEGLMGLFDSAAGEHFPAPDAPPLFRMVYGGLNRYTMPMIVRGENPAWGDHTLFDLKALLPLKDGVLPVILFLDTPGSFTANRDPAEPVRKLLRSYVENYERVLKPIFARDVVRMPRIDAPGCGVAAVRYIATPGGPVGEPVASKTDAIVQGAAFAWEERGERRAAVVLMDSGTSYGAGAVRTGIRYPIVRDPGLAIERMELDVAPNAAAFASRHAVTVSLVARDLTLLDSSMYKVTFHELGTARRDVGRLQGSGTFGIALNPASLAVLIVER